MKSYKISSFVVTAVLGAVAGSPAFASDKWLGNRGDNWEEHIVSTKTRAQVIAELNAARSAGLISYGQEPRYPDLPVAKSGRSREQVRAEAIDAAKNRQQNIEYSSGR
ncbi:DUF4148 domain-containing protein [Herbaspirillum sp. HC18]|nr:DUF4148 domain-containing protein [Herbaspirillum sp. HC18]